MCVVLFKLKHLETAGSCCLLIIRLGKVGPKSGQITMSRYVVIDEGDWIKRTLFIHFLNLKSKIYQNFKDEFQLRIKI